MYNMFNRFFNVNRNFFVESYNTHLLLSKDNLSLSINGYSSFKSFCLINRSVNHDWNFDNLGNRPKERYIIFCVESINDMVSQKCKNPLVKRKINTMNFFDVLQFL